MWRSKRANIIYDLFLIITIIIIFIIMLIISLTIWNGFNSNIQSLPESVASTEIKGIIDGFTNWFYFLDKLLPASFIFMWLGVIFLSIRINPDHPIYFIISLLILAIFTGVSFVIVDVLTTFTDNALLITVSQSLGNTYFFAHNLHFISFFIMIISSVWFWTKGQFFGDELGVQR